MIHPSIYFHMRRFPSSGSLGQASLIPPSLPSVDVAAKSQRRPRLMDEGVSRMLVDEICSQVSMTWAKNTQYGTSFRKKRKKSDFC